MWNRSWSCALTGLWLFAVSSVYSAPLDNPPVLRLDAGGPTADITVLCFSPDGRTLYAAGFDKIVRAWRRPPNSDHFELVPRAYRVPVAPGTAGTINALAVSPDGQWLAVSGLGVWEGEAGFRDNGKVFPASALSSQRRREQATIYLLQTQAPYAVKVLRHHEGLVVNLRFAPAHPRQPPLLVSLARESGPRVDSYTGKACLWDITRAAYRDARGRLVDPGALLAEQTISAHLTQPDAGLAVRHAGPGVKQLQVAIAWGDGWLRIWDPDTGKVLRVRDAALNHTAAYTSGGKALVTGAIDARTAVGRLQPWTDERGQDPVAAAGPVLLPPDQHMAAYVPHALALLPGLQKGQPDLAVVALRVRARKTKEDQCWLLPVDLANARPLPPVRLWNYDKLPALAASPDGRYVAVSGNLAHEVWVFDARNLVLGRPTKQVLRSSGSEWRSLAFVQRQARPGAARETALRLQQAPRAGLGQPGEPHAGDLIADFARRDVTPARHEQGWQIISPADEGWKIVQVQGTPSSQAGAKYRAVISWQHRAEVHQTAVLLEATARIEDAVLIPPAKAGGIPLLALAIWDDPHREPTLRIYRTDSGEQVRQYVGHNQRIFALAVSADGKRLASTAADETVCTWSLADLPGILDRQGSVPGLVVEQRQKALLVDRVDADCPVRTDLAVGDTLERLDIRGKPVRLKTAADFYDALWNQPRGTRAALVVRHAGKPHTVAFALGQGIDERHPLFSLFVPNAHAGVRPWIGWSPLGWFDASGPEAEKHVGWHFNPKHLDEPATFAPLQTKRYHDTFYRRGVLGRLFAGTEAVTEADRPIIPQPRISIEGVRTPGTASEMLGDNRYLVRHRQVGLRLRIEGPSVEKRQVESLTWRIDQGPRHQIDLRSAREQGLSEKLLLPGVRGTYTVQVELRTREDTPQVATARLTLIERRPAPRLSFAPDWLRQHFGAEATRYRVVKEPTFTLEALVQPAKAVTVTLGHNGRSVHLTPVDGQLRQTLQLTPGENVIVLSAYPANTPKSDQAAESAVERFLLLYHPEPVPEVHLTSLGLGEEEQERLPIQPGNALTVRTPMLHLHATIKAARQPRIELLDAQGHALRTVDGRPVDPARLTPDKEGKTWSLNQRLELSPGRHTVIVRAQAGTKSGRAMAILDYRPPLPEVEVLAPVHDAIFIEGRDQPMIRPRLRFRTSTDYPFVIHAEVTQDGSKASLTESLNWVGARRVRELPPLRLRPGENHVRIVLSRGSERSEPIERAVFYRQPPRILKGAASQPVTRPFTDITLTVASPSKPTVVRLQSNGHTEESAAARVQPTAEPATWTVRVDAIPAPAKTNTVRLWVGNTDGLSLEPFTASVGGIRPRIKPPEVRITTPAHVVGESTARLEFIVHSAGPLSTVELRRPGEPPLPYRPLTMTSVTGGLELRGELEVPVREGANTYTVVASNEGGRGQAAVELTRPRAAVRLVVQPLASSVSQPELRLTGYVAFRDEDEARRGTASLANLRVYVNEFLQRPVVVETDDPRGPRFRSWHVDLMLNRPDNRIEIECSNLPLDAGRRQRFTVHCTRPVAPATLHVLVVGVDVRDARLLYKQAFRALQARADIEHGGLQSPIFSRVIMHPYRPTQRRRVLYDDVDKGKVRTALDSIRSFIHTQGSSNDVVMIYWTGKGPVRDEDAWYLPTSDSSPRRPARETDVAVKDLLGGDEETPGARLLLLDVPSVTAVAEHMPRDVAGTHAGVIYYAWSRAQQPLHGLLLAVEKSALTSRPVTLEDVVRAGEQMQKQHPGTLQLSDNLNVLPPFRGLVITRSAMRSP